VADESQRLVGGAVVSDFESAWAAWRTATSVDATSTAIVADREKMSVGKTREPIPVALRRTRT
jgi:hypothetical protein